MTKKMICFDIDGTLLTSEGKMNISALHAIHQLGQNPSIVLCIATGRGPYMFHELREQLRIDNYISYNGQYCVSGGQEIFCNPLEPMELEKIILRAGQFDIPVGFMTESYTKTTVAGHKFVKESFQTVEHKYPIVDMLNLSTESVYQGQLFCTVEQERAFLTSNEYFRFVRWHPYAVDIVPPNGSKLEGIKQMASRFGIDLSNVIAFGDGLNDIEMIQNVGLGICMSNGKEQVKEVADYITKSNDTDGILVALKHLRIL